MFIKLSQITVKESRELNLIFLMKINCESLSVNNISNKQVRIKISISLMLNCRMPNSWTGHD
jgi:hypothetical protein